MEVRRTLGQRLGCTTHISPLRFKLERLRDRYPCADRGDLEEWLVDIANARDARVVVRPSPHAVLTTPPPPAELSNEELVIAICQLQNRDEPQLLRLAAQLISRGQLDIARLCRLVELERVEPVIGALANQALKVAPAHPLWGRLAYQFGPAVTTHEPVLHWTRLAEPIMQAGHCNAIAWKLVA